jgi:broad specificity phosphatase PhoE
MTTRVLLVCHAASAATRHAAFPSDEPLLASGTPDPLPRAHRAVCGPERRCRQTAELFGLPAEVEPGLRDCDYGRWRGRTLAELSESSPAAVHTWLNDPASAPHGGESIVDIVARAGAWLDSLPDHPGRLVAITHPAVIKAALVHAIRATPDSFWRIDIAPLSRTALSGAPGRWTLSSLG